MRYEVRTGMVVGTAKREAWSQVATIPAPGGQLLALVTLKYEGEGDVLEVAGVGGGILESLKNSLGAEKIEMGVMKRRVGELENELGEELELSIILAGVDNVGGKLVVVGRGEVELYLAREKRVAKILDAGEEVRGVEGEIRQGDKFVLCTMQVIAKIGLRVIEEVMESGEMTEQLAVLVHGQEDSSLLAVLRGEIGVGESEPRRVNSEPRKRINYKKIVERVSGWGKRSIKIKTEQRKHNAIIGIGLLLMLIVGVGVGVVSRTRVVKERGWRQVEALVVSKMNEARSVADLNPERAKGLLAEAKGEIEDYTRKQADEKYLTMAEALTNSLHQSEQEVFRQQEVAVTTLAELSLLGIQRAGAMTVDDKGNIMLVEEDGTKLAGMNADDKSNWKAEIANLSGVVGMGIYAKKGYLLTSEGVKQVSVEGGEATNVIEPDELWGEVTKLAMFAGNAYILDVGEGEIWKYPALTEGFGARRRWFGAGISLDLTKVVDMEVDGDIWIVTSTGKLERYSRGVPIAFSMEGFPAQEAGRLANPTAVATTDDRVYVLEAGAKRAVVFNKESGKYEKQLLNEEFKEGREMVVVKNKGYVLLPDRIVWFEL